MSLYQDTTFLICNARSRSAWLSVVMRELAVVSEHDCLRHMSSIKGDFKDYVDNLVRLGITDDKSVFIADSGAALFTKQLMKVFEGAKFLFIVRDPAEVSASLAKIGLEAFPDPRKIYLYMQEVYTARTDLRDRFKLRAFKSEELAQYPTFAQVSDFIAGNHMGRELHKQFCNLNIQCHLPSHMKDVDPEKNTQLMRESEL